MLRSVFVCPGLSDDALHSSPRRNSNSADEIVPPKPPSRAAVSPGPSTAPPAVCPPALSSHINQELLTSGALTLPGTRPARKPTRTKKQTLRIHLHIILLIKIKINKFSFLKFIANQRLRLHDSLE